jgi:hypothetical protein
LTNENERKPISPEEREARKVSREVDAKKAMTEHEQGQNAFNDNRERLRAERLAREAAAMITPKAEK